MIETITCYWRVERDRFHLTGSQERAGYTLNQGMKDLTGVKANEREGIELDNSLHRMQKTLSNETMY